MKLLLDECLPRKMKFLFSGSSHECETVREAGFGGKENGELLSLAEGNFNVLITYLLTAHYSLLTCFRWIC